MIGGLIGLLIYLIVVGIIVWLLLWVIQQVPLPEPFYTPVRILIIVIGALIVIVALLGLLNVSGVPKLL